MLKITIAVEPNCRKDVAYGIGEIEITNITRSGGRMSSDYLWRIKCDVPHREPIEASGYYVDWYGDTSIDLIHAILSEWKSGRPLPIDNHGFQTLPEGISISAAEYWEKLDSKEKGK